jgi:membrane-associated phospholipid phosphatase
MFYSMLIATLVSTACFMLYPTQIARVPLNSADVGEMLRGLLYLIDSPTNCFPSLHVALAILSAIFISRENRVFGKIAVCWALLVIVSTLTVKQHYFVDVIGGVVVAAFSYALVSAKTEKANGIC